MHHGGSLALSLSHTHWHTHTHLHAHAYTQCAACQTNKCTQIQSEKAACTCCVGLSITCGLCIQESSHAARQAIELARKVQISEFDIEWAEDLRKWLQEELRQEACSCSFQDRLSSNLPKPKEMYCQRRGELSHRTNRSNVAGQTHRGRGVRSQNEDSSEQCTCQLRHRTALFLVLSCFLLVISLQRLHLEGSLRNER